MKIAFHSYKGGVGRTKVMVGAGALLAMLGKRVGLLDFDLDASSLATFFRVPEDEIGEKELLHILQSGDYRVTHDAMLDISDLLVERFGCAPQGAGCLKFIPTISDPEISDRIVFNPAARHGVDILMGEILENCGIDVLLIDLRPGLSPSSSIIMPLVDRAVVVTRLDRQNIYGLRRIIPLMERNDLDPLLVANMVPNSPLSDERIKELSKVTGHPVDVRLELIPELVFDDDFRCATEKDSPMRIGLEALVDRLFPVQATS